jgi:glycosyltransferase involved in cell wall biosynthesis
MNKNITFRNKENLLTAIIPVNKMAGRLDNLDSWIQQIDNYPIQLIIVHDIADKDTDYELKKIINRYNSTNLVLLEGQYGSPGYARNAGFEAATGEWIAFWDSDDKPRFRTILNEISEAHLIDDVLVGGFNTVSALNGDINRSNSKNASIESVRMNPGIWRIVFRKKIVNDLKFTNLRMGEDQLFLSQMNFVELNTKYVAEIFYEYTIEQKNQLTNSKFALADLQKASIMILKHLKNTNSKNIIFFDAFLIIRQQLTLIKKGNTFLRILVIKFIITYLRKLNLNILIATIRALAEILISTREHKLR